MLERAQARPQQMVVGEDMRQVAGDERAMSRLFDACAVAAESCAPSMMFFLLLPAVALLFFFFFFMSADVVAGDMMDRYRWPAARTAPKIAHDGIQRAPSSSCLFAEEYGHGAGHDEGRRRHARRKKLKKTHEAVLMTSFAAAVA